mgnify:CR=1 FL=1
MCRKKTDKHKIKKGAPQRRLAGKSFQFSSDFKGGISLKKINWKVRFKNPMFWLTAIPAVTAFVYSVLGLFGVVPRFGEDSVVNIGSAAVAALTTLGVLIDPTTKGVCDSCDVLKYEEPKEADEVKEE